MDELAERAKLALLDLTDDVIELIIERKRKAFTKKQEDELRLNPQSGLATPEESSSEGQTAVVIEVVCPPDIRGANPTVVDEIPEVEERTYYPVVEPEPIPLPPPPTPVIPEPPMDRSVEPISRRGLPWQRRR